MNNIGLVIKVERLRQNMKQITLAKGICTPSYLSKIENILTVPSDEVAMLLVKRLNIDYKYLSRDMDAEFFTDFLLLYKQAINYRNKKDIINKLVFYIENEFNFQNESYLYNFKIMQLRVHLIIEKHSNIVNSLLNTLESQKIRFNIHQLFHFNLNCGIYYHLKGDFICSLTYLESNLNLINKFPIEDWELADFYNVLSLSYLSNNQDLHTIDCAKKSLKIYKDSLLFERAIDSYIIIAIVQKRKCQYREAEETLKLAQQLAMDFKLKDMIGRINQNLGTLFSLQGNSKKAIEKYMASLKNNRNKKSNLISILSVIQEYSKNGDADQIILWCHKGLYEIENTSLDKFESYFHHFNVFLSIQRIDEVGVKKLKTAIKYFENKKDYRHVHKYSLLLANIYFETSNFKNAGIYFKKSNDMLFHQKSIKTWEDL